MSVGVEVDALALMLDGAVDQIGIRLGNASYESLVFMRKYTNTPPLMERMLLDPGWAEVAEAILELEAWADWYNSDHCTGRPGRCGDLAGRAKPAIKRMAHPQFEYLEAAARLRDGWRPRGWRRKVRR